MKGLINDLIGLLIRRLQTSSICEMIDCTLTLGRKMSLYTLRANMDDAPRTDESADDMVAAETAPNPQKET